MHETKDSSVYLWLVATSKSIEFRPESSKGPGAKLGDIGDMFEEAEAHLHLMITPCWS